MYAEQEQDHLMFDSKKELSMLETEFALSIDEKTMAYLKKFHSIPAFLSQITLDLFHKQTAIG